MTKELILPADQSRVWRNSKDGGISWYFMSNDLSISVFPISTQLSFSIKENPLIIPEGSLVGELKFMPFGTYHFLPQKRLSAVAKWIEGLSDFFDYIDFTEGIAEPEYLYGYTNDRMAAFRARFGFAIDSCKSKSMEVGVVGKTSEVRQKLTEIKKRNINGATLEELLLKRESRQKKL